MCAQDMSKMICLIFYLLPLIHSPMAQQPNACYRNQLRKEALQNDESQEEIIVAFSYQMLDVEPAQYIYMEANEKKYNLVHFANTCNKTFSVSYNPNQTGSMTIYFSLRVHPNTKPFAEYEFHFNHQNYDHFLELEDENGFLNLHIDFNSNGSTVLPGQWIKGFMNFKIPDDISGSGKDCAVVFFMNRYAIFNLVTYDNPSISYSPSLKLRVRFDVADAVTGDFVNQRNVSVFGWRFTCQASYTKTNQTKTTFVLYDAWQHVRVSFTIYDVFGYFKATTRYFYRDNVILVANAMMEFHIYNLHFLHFSDLAQELMMRRNWIPLVADSEHVTRCRTHGFNGKIIETFYKLFLVSRRSFLRPTRNKSTDIAIKKPLHGYRLYQCKLHGNTKVKPLP
ncbi:hypothetical protein RF11_01955 [Thelohanellus kitauei]|uniref:Uncharacterized protein n=1 Tax=Thelohanellus kitauei TaxID=669202 RepID=A0A0C2IR89_THEKT|nr:hypothetical protein RF11_01955 [Thelohanellus kitauei]